MRPLFPLTVLPTVRKDLKDLKKIMIAIYSSWKVGSRECKLHQMARETLTCKQMKRSLSLDVRYRRESIYYGNLSKLLMKNLLDP